MKKIFLIIALLFSVVMTSQQQTSVYKWNAAITYNINDLISLNGVIYKATTSNTNDTPPSANWELSSGLETDPVWLAAEANVPRLNAANSFIGANSFEYINGIRIGSDIGAGDGLEIKNYSVDGSNSGMSIEHIGSTGVMRFKTGFGGTIYFDAYNSNDYISGEYSLSGMVFNSDGDFFFSGLSGDVGVKADDLSVSDEYLPTKPWVRQEIAGLGGGDVTAVNTPVLNDFARWTTGTSIEGRSYAETRTDLGLVIGTDVQAFSTILENTTASYTTTAASAIGINSLKETNATHTGDVAGATALTIGADKILESHLKSVNAPTDEYALTYEATTGDFEWQVMSAVDLDPYATKSVDAKAQAVSYTTISADNGKHIDMSAGTTITLDDAGFNVDEQLHIFNNTGASLTFAYGTGDTAIQGALPDLADGQYAWCTLKAANSWSVIVGGASGGGVGDAVLANSQTFTGLNTFQNNGGINLIHGSGNNSGDGGSLFIGSGDGFGTSITGSSSDLGFVVGNVNTEYDMSEYWANAPEDIMRQHDSDTRYRSSLDYAAEQYDTYSTYGTGWTDGTNTKVGTAATGLLTTNGRFTGNATYDIYLTITVSAYTSGTLQVKAGNSSYSTNTISAVGTYRFKVANTSQANLFTINPTVAFTGTISEIRMDSGWTLDETVSTGGGISNVVEDLTPELGGNLDAKNNDISNLYEVGFQSLSDVTPLGLTWYNVAQSEIWSVQGNNSKLDLTHFTEVNLGATNTTNPEVHVTEGSVEFNESVISGANLSTLTKSTTSSILSTDMGETIFSTGAGALTYTIPDTLTEGEGATFTIIAEGAGEVTITTSGTATINGSTSFDIVINGAASNKINAVQFIQRTASSDDWIAIGAY